VFSRVLPLQLSLLRSPDLCSDAEYSGSMLGAMSSLTIDNEPQALAVKLRGFPLLSSPFHT
jgi:hypothetical protein